MKIILLTLLLLAGLSFEAPAGPRPRRAAQVWRGFRSPPYLAGRLPRRPKQHVLDSLARAARRPSSITTNRPR